MAKIIAKVEKRTILGRKTNSLRLQGIVPVNIFGKGIESTASQLTLKEFIKLFEKAGETNLIYLTIDGEKGERPCLISNVQYHPLTDTVIHVDFRQVDLKESVTAEIPVELTGEAPAVANENATIVTQLLVIEVEALPTDLPDKFTLDISVLAKVGDHLKISDLKYDNKKVTISLDPETVIVAAQAQQAEEVVETPVEAPAETPAEGEPTPTEAPKEEKPEKSEKTA